MKKLKPIPCLIVSILSIVIGIIGVRYVVYGIEYSNIIIDAIRLFLVSVFAFFFAYGLINFINDIKNGNLSKIINKINEVLYDDN